MPKWVRVDYGTLVDGRAITHSGEPVGLLLQRLAGRPMPASGERRDDAVVHRLLDPLLERYAFVLSDALDALVPRTGAPLVDVGALWDTGEAQPAWVELVRARRLVLESDGEGHLRACLPGPSLQALAGEIGDDKDPVEAAKEAWNDAWPVLRHALAGERRRLQRRKGGELPALEVEVHAYRHLPALSIFDLGAIGWHTAVTDTGLGVDRPALELSKLQTILDRGQTIEGARLDASGRLRWFVSEPDTKPTILGRAPTLADVAVAYRAIAHGGNGEPYMSLDRAASPHIANVNYGGRLRDTALGLVSMLSDVRFKTFSLGVDLLGEGDVRDAIRKSLPEFRTHLEKFASDPSAGEILNQQTRFWFYPDDVDLTLSEQGDVLAFRKVRMSAASERVKSEGVPPTDPAWTKDTVSYLNAHYDALASQFPELHDLDESVRLLAVFTWLQAAKSRGLPVPDLDVLMALELPALPTPRRFPELLTHDILPVAGHGGVVDVLDRTDVGLMLDRLEPHDGRALPAARRFARDLAMLSPQIPDQSAVGREMLALKPEAGDFERDALSYRAERLLMHARVLATVPEARRQGIDELRKREPGTRVFSVGIGGVDLGMSAVLARAAARGGRLGLAAGERASAENATAPAAPHSAVSESPSLPASEWPDHGLGSADERTVTTLPDGAGTIVAMRRPGSIVRQGSFKSGDTTTPWDEFALAMEGSEARFRRRVLSAGAPVVQRFEGGRFLSYRLDRAGTTLRAAPAVLSIPSQAFSAPQVAAGPPVITPSLLVMDLPPAAEASADDRAEPPAIQVRLRSANARERAAMVPRPLLQRLVRGREFDVTPDRPLQAFAPASELLGSSRALMILQSPDEIRPPWSGEIPVRSGEEDAATLAAALSAWWSADPSPAARAVVGVDAQASPSRWEKSPPLDGTVAVVAEEGPLPAQAEVLRTALAAFPKSPAAAKLVVVVSAESSGVLGRRLRALAVDPAMAGKIVAVVAFGGPARTDLPASLLSEGRWAAFGVCEAGPVGFRRTMSEVSAWIVNVQAASSNGKRVEDVEGPFTWYY